MKTKILIVIMIFSMAAFICLAQDTPVSGQNDGSSSVTIQAVDSVQTGAETSAQTDTSATGKGIMNYTKSHTGITIIIIVFLIMLVIPFIPALREMINPKDNKPLMINQEYTRDPRFMDKHLLEELQPAIENKDNKAVLKYKNSVQIDKVQDYKASEAAQVNHVMLVSGDMTTGKNSSFKQPVYVQGKANLNDDNNFDILMTEGDVKSGKNLKIEKWLSSNANIKVGNDCVLGKRSVSSGILQIGKGCRFTNLYANPVATYDVDFNLDLSKPVAVEFTNDQNGSMTEVSDTNWYISKGFMTIPPYSLVNNSMIVKSDLVLRRGVVVNGNIKVYGKVMMERDVRIYGELICIGDIEVGEFSYIRENLFTQSKIILKNGVRVGLPGQHKTIVGKKGITLEKNVILYGNVMTAGEGQVV